MELGAEVAPDALAAIDASPVAVACVTGYDDLRALLEPVPADGLAGRTIVNLTTGTLEEAQEMQELVTSRGALYLDGHIPIYPRHIGLPETIIMFCGPTALWEQNRALLLALGGASLYFGEEIGGFATTWRPASARSSTSRSPACSRASHPALSRSDRSTRWCC